MQKKTKTHAAPGLRQYTEFTIHPRSNATASITIMPREEFNLALNGTYQSSRYVLVNNIREVRDLGTESITRSWYAQTKPILYFDFVANYWLTKRFKVTAGAYNVFDINYGYQDASVFNSNAAVLSEVDKGGLPGRSIFAGFEYRYGE